MSEHNQQPEELMEEYGADILTLEDEDGNEHTFEVVDTLDEGDTRYLAMVPYHEDPAQQLEEDAELLIFRAGVDDGEEVLDIVDDEGELERVGALFAQRLSELYDIDLDDL